MIRRAVSQPRGTLTPPIKWHGGKHYLAPKIVALFSSHVHYVEPFAGGLAVLLAKDSAGVSEVVNDLDSRLTNFWRVLQDETLYRRFSRRVQVTPFSQPEWNQAGKWLDDPDPVVRAIAFFVLCRQSLAGRMNCFAPLSRNRTRRAMNEQASAWLTAVEGLPAVHARLKRVVVLNKPALDVIRQEDGKRTLFYLDPPYLHDTRTAADTYGDFEMSREQHEKLLDLIQHVKGKVVLSGYRSPLYDRELRRWRCEDFDLPNNAAGGKSKRRMTESVWMSY